jgi:UPF0176 protein
MKAITDCALYRFTRLDNFDALKKPLQDLLKQLDIRGTLLLAEEGVNGTVAGSQEAIEQLLEWFDKDPRLAGIDHKQEIVTMGINGIDPLKAVGTYVKPKDWNALISDPDVVLVDTRNDYEVGIGTFKGAIDPKTKTFREFPEYVKGNLDPEKNKKVAMFCTGGIRCEKSTAYLKEQGFEEVYHLEGGILKYLEDVPSEDSMWEGECFVFDNRVTVDHNLEKGHYDLCHGCRMPILETDKERAEFEQGVSCHHCLSSLSDLQIQRFRERERQLQLAKLRGEAHMGDMAIDAIEQRRKKKQKLRSIQRERAGPSVK